jgi:cellulose synthase/poly-beta-1,6-N-acetylglucosamine synthase-like glycosyltransferase
MLTFLAVVFWFGLFLVFYTYIGYGILLYILVRIKRIAYKKTPKHDEYIPDVTLLVAAYNERDYILDKIKNSQALHYPAGKLKLLFVTDGSDDGTPDIIAGFPEIRLLHQPERAGKIAAVARAMPEVETEIVIFTDANTLLNADAVHNMVRHFANPGVGVVAGEKRIKARDADEAAGAGEGFYWRYESKLKKWDDELYSVMGAAGELFAIRTKLYEHVPHNALIEDFYMTMRMTAKGYKIAYAPDAYALEEPSDSVNEELKRKIRIAAGGIQSIIWLGKLLNPLRYGVLSFQYISHRVLRWSLAPLALPVIFFTNLSLLGQGWIYRALFVLQVIFYGMALMGFLLEKKNLRLKILFIPYYFCMMNYAVYRGFFRYLQGSQSVLWEKAKRRQAP